MFCRVRERQPRRAGTGCDSSSPHWQDKHGKLVAKELKAAGLQVITDFRNEKINYKVREHSLQKVPVILVCGMREAEERSVNMRRLGSQNQTSLKLDDAIQQLRSEATPPDLLRAAAE